eukprot:TRINITY_DN14282_c0_g1_i3.p1 TRINITY_DN14282_c0_g1~~TRINITY_DN14282_c0_g1_i3.p1  ORF type:complete len:278 (+),score=55.20 TRINITY_DN14282_c0_g1_i3:111-944(+)
MSGLALYIRAATGDLVAVEVPPSATVGDVIDEHARVTGRRPGALSSAADAGALPRGELLADLGIGAETTLYEIDHLQWHPDHLRGPGGADPVAPTLLSLAGPGTERGGGVLSASCAGGDVLSASCAEETPMFAALSQPYRPGSRYRSPLFGFETYASSMAFGLIVGVPTVDTRLDSPELLLLVYGTGPVRRIAGVSMRDIYLKPEHGPFCLVIDEQLRVQYEMHGQGAAEMLPMREDANQSFREAVARLPEDTVTFPFVHVSTQGVGSKKFEWVVTM